METFIEKTKDLFWIMFTAIASVFTPVQNILILLFIAFIFNIFTGIVADIRVNKKSFNMKKAFDAITQLMFWAALIIFLDYGSKLLNEVSLGVTAIKWVTYIVVYFYLTNIFRNASLVYPHNQAIKFIHELLSTAIFWRLKEMLGFKNIN